MTLNGINGVHSTTRRLTAGIYAPIPTFFKQDASESVDIEAIVAQVVYLAGAGVPPLLCGSMGEAHHLLPSERASIIRASRSALDKAGFESTPIITGTGSGSLQETLMLTRDAADHGSDAVIVIASGYFAGVLANDKKALHDFFWEVAEQSPIPVLIYNCECCGSRKLVWFETESCRLKIQELRAVSTLIQIQSRH